MSDLPDTLGRYEIIELIGRGAMGVVYKARDPSIDRVVAIKAIKTSEIEESPDGLELIQRFKREVQTAGILTHSNIVTIYDVGQDKDLSWIAMEFIDGPSLAKIIEDRVVLPLQDLLAIFVKICSGVDFAHRHGIIHRDIKPANILLTEGWEPKIADFGIARVASSEMTRTGIILGTPSYMSPEQVTGQKIDNRSDIFSLGIILYELITGERPFLGDNPTTIMYKIVHTEPLAPGTVNLTLPQGLSGIVVKALAKNPGDRFQRAGELANELIALVKSTPELAVATSRLDMPTASLNTGDIASAFDRYQSVEAPTVVRRRSPVPLIILAVTVIVVAIASGLFFLSQGGKGGGSGDGAPAPILTKEITITTEPEGAAFFVDGERQEGLTPATFELSRPKDASVSITAEKDCLAAEGVVRFGDEEPSELTLSMEPKRREVEISSEPAGAEVLIDGERRGETPLKVTIECGKEYQVRLAAANHNPETVTLDWESEPVVVSLDKIEPGTLELVGGGYPVTIYRGRTMLARNVRRSIRLSPGRYSLRLENWDYFLNMTRTVEVKEGQTATVPLPGLGKLWVYASPMNAEVGIDGRNLGQILPIRGRQIVAGIHTIAFVWGGVRREKTVEVKAGEDSTVRELLEQ